MSKAEMLKQMFQSAAPRPALSEIENNVYEYLYTFTAANSFQPSVREIGMRFGFTNTAAVVKVLNMLNDKGYIARHNGNARALVLR